MGKKYNSENIKTLQLERRANSAYKSLRKLFEILTLTNRKLNITHLQYNSEIRRYNGNIAFVKDKNSTV